MNRAQKRAIKFGNKKEGIRKRQTRASLRLMGKGKGNKTIR